jgi:integrase
MLTLWQDFLVKKAKLEVLRYCHHPKFKFVLDLRAFGRGRKFFKTRAEADAERLRQLTTLERHGREAIGLSQRELSDFMTARNALAKHDKTINDAAGFYLNYLERVRRHGVTVTTLANELIEAKRKDGRSEIYLRDLRNIFAIFARDFGDRAIAGITVEELDDWFRALPGSPKTRTNFRSNVSVLFGYATGRRVLDSNPVLNTAKPKLPDNPPEVFSVEELQALLDAASKEATEVLPMLAIGAFAGLRDGEIKRLDWSEVDLARGHIEVTAAKAKSARRRIVPIQPNLAVWLRPFSAMTGALLPIGYRSGLDRVRKAAGLTKWPNNGLRHSFASYRLASINDAPRVAAELGHTSPQMLYSTYREVVLPQDAERYWDVKPDTAMKNVVEFRRV